MSEIKKPYELKEGDYCYIQDRVCHVHKIRTACGEYFMAGYPVFGEKKKLDHIVDCTETVKVPVVSIHKVAKVEESVVTLEGIQREVSLPSGPVLDNIKSLLEEGKEVSVKAITVDGNETIVDVV